ncbi:MAG: M28 family peptidase, partial [Balneolaceae bacterium]
MRRNVLTILTCSSLLFTASCQNVEEPRFSFEEQGREVPRFSSENAYGFIEDQVDFGPRSPGSDGHMRAKDYFVDQLENYAGERFVYVQSFSHTGYDGISLPLHNIIAAFNVQSRNRILLAAHWDTRPRAEEDPDKPDSPIPGADDGGSGVAVLLELARILSEFPPPVGIDIILFDGEDYGESGDLDNYFLGSRYWSMNQPVEGYSPRFGILLDMVGGDDARFPKEGYSVRIAPQLVDAVWRTAAQLGYESFFPDERGAMISDDHVIVERNTGIPVINIINHRRSENGGAEFPPYWHTT